MNVQLANTDTEKNSLHYLLYTSTNATTPSSVVTTTTPTVSQKSFDPKESKRFAAFKFSALGKQ